MNILCNFDAKPINIMFFKYFQTEKCFKAIYNKSTHFIKTNSNFYAIKTTAFSAVQSNQLMRQFALRIVFSPI